MGGDHDVGRAARHDRARGVIADPPGALLEPGGGRLAREAHHTQRHGQSAAGVLDDLSVARRGRAARGVVDVQGGELEPQAQPRVDGAHDVEQSHRVGAAGQHEERPLAGPQQGAGGDVVGRSPAQGADKSAGERPLACRVHRRARDV